MVKEVRKDGILENMCLTQGSNLGTEDKKEGHVEKQQKNSSLSIII